MSECLLCTTKWVNACCLPPNEWMPVVYHQMSECLLFTTKMSECLLFTTKWVNACCLPPNEWMPVVYHQMSECLLFATKWVNACCLPPNEWMPVVYHQMSNSLQLYQCENKLYFDEMLWYVFTREAASTSFVVIGGSRTEVELANYHTRGENTNY
jgi:hypothetical protein